MVDFSQIYKLLNDNNVSGSTNNNGSVNSNAENYENISVFSNDNSSPNSTSQLDDEEFLWWEKRLEEKREEELDNSSDNIPDGWESITSEKSKALGFLWETGSYTFETSSGVKISTKDIDNIEIYENKETGEVVVINANGATITSNSKDAKISVYNSVIDKIDTSKGNDEVNIYKSEVDKIDTGRGIDSINIQDSTVNKVNSGSGNDTVNVSDSTISNTNTSSNFLWGVFDTAEDTVILNDSTTGKIKTGKGEDNIIANNSTIDVLNTGSGGDSVSINQTDVEKNKGAKKDTVVQDYNYIDIDIETIKNIGVQGTIQIDETNSISTSEYINYLLDQNVGFETEEEYQQYVLQSLTSNLNTMKSVFSKQEDSDGCVSDGYNWLKDLTGLGITDKDIEDMLAQQEAIVQGLTDAMNGNSNMSFEQAYEYYTGTTYSKEKIDKYMETANLYSAIMVGCQYDEDYLDKFEEATGRSVEDVTKEYALCQLDTFGKSTGLEDLVEKYSQDQESFKDKLSTAISAAGITCIVVGAVISCVFPPAAPAGAALMTAGKYISLGGMFVDNALDLVDDSTDKDGLTKEELGNIALETGVEAVSYAAGRGIGKLTNGLNNVVSSKVAEAGAGKVTSYIAGQAAETVVDTGLSLAADYAIAQGQSLITTGEFMDAEDYWSLDRFLGEGKNQLIGILTGLSSAKVDAYQQGVIKTAQGLILEGDTDGAKTYLKKSGIKMNDSSFESFVKNVQDVDTQMKLQAPQVEEAQRTVDTEAQKPVDADEGEEITDGLAGRIGIQFFAEKTTEANSVNSNVEPANKFADKDVPTEVNQQLSSNAVKLNETYSEHISEVEAETKQRFSGLKTVEDKNITARAKGDESTFNKLADKFKKGKLKSTNFEDCSDKIGDAYGTRIQMNSVDSKVAKTEITKALDGSDITYEQFVDHLTNVRYDSETEQFVNYRTGETVDQVTAQKIESIKAPVLDSVKEKQSQEVVSRLVDLINNADENEPPIITELNNYGSSVSSYFTDAQLEKIAIAYEAKYHKKLDIVTKLDQSRLPEGECNVSEDGTNTLTVENDYAKYTDKGATKDSGYTSSQMNTKHKLSDGSVGNGELQVRGTEVNAFADVEHIPYDIRKGKITADNTEYSSIYKIIDGMDDTTYSAYNKYLTAVYESLRLNELGIPCEEPKIESFLDKSKFSNDEPNLLSRSGLEKLHG